MLDSQRRLLVTAQVRGCGFALLGRLLGNKLEAGAEPRKRMASYKAGDSKREQFRRYLEKAGVLDTLTKILVELYEEPEKPNNALDFLKQHLGAAGPETPDVEALRLEVAELKQKYEAVLEENKELKAKLSQHEPPTDEKQVE